jgi:hypothetical protein
VRHKGAQLVVLQHRRFPAHLNAAPSLSS